MASTSTADWIVAISTAAGAVGTVGTLGFLAWQWASDRRDKRLRKRKKQARKVSCWLEVDSIHDTVEAAAEQERTIAARVHWQNLSSAPVTQLDVVCAVVPKLIRGQPVQPGGALLPEHWDDAERTIIVTTVAPHSEGNRPVEYTFRGFGAATPPAGTEPVLMWWFTDADGVDWMRNGRGTFEERKPDPAEAGAMMAEVFRAAFSRARRPGRSGLG
jgi:hypothetical protein